MRLSALSFCMCCSRWLATCLTVLGCLRHWRASTWPATSSRVRLHAHRYKLQVSTLLSCLVKKQQACMHTQLTDCFGSHCVWFHTCFILVLHLVYTFVAAMVYACVTGEPQPGQQPVHGCGCTARMSYTACKHSSLTGVAAIVHDEDTCYARVPHCFALFWKPPCIISAQHAQGSRMPDTSPSLQQPS
jgi:hypothetical protein